MSHIFISYSRKNSECVYRVIEEMKQNDFPRWVDVEGIPMSSEWLEKIEQAIKAARVFMLFWSAEAKDSKHVQHELRIAKELSIQNKIKVLVVMLDKIETPLDYIQRYDMMTDCSPTAVKNLVNALPKEWKQFSMSKTLAEQSHTEVDDEFASVQFDDNEYCKAYIVGKKGQRLPKQPENLVVALQFFKPTNHDMLTPIIKSLPSENSWILHITGPIDGDQYRLNDYNRTQWESCRDFIVKCVRAVGNPDITVVHLFTLTPNALLGGVTMPFYRFWHLKLYNFVPPKYEFVMDVPRS